MRNTRRPLAVVAIAAALGLVLAGCTTEPDASERAEQPAPTAAVAEANGLSADPTQNSSDALVKAVTSDDWAVPVEIIDCGEPGCDGERTQSVYTPLSPDEITEDWELCAVVPHVKDPYWLGIDANLVQEAQRAQVGLQVYEAGGYTEIGTQLDQLSNCVANGADAVIVSAVSNEALNATIDQIAAKGIPVIDAVNGVTSTNVDGRALFDYCTLGGNLGRHLAESGEEVKAVWFPGPAGVGSLEQLMSCFEAQTEGSNVEVLGVSYGDTGKDAQLALVENALSAYPEMNYIIGSATTVDAAVGPLTERGIAGQVQTASYYFTPEVYSLLESGGATCSSAGNDLILGKIAVDMALRVLEGQPFNGGNHIGMAANVVCGSAAGEQFNNLDTLVKQLNLPPEGFKPTFSVKN
ncbi:TMAO reductase system periplasmic protein TorT [Leucobacter denitrificans]|uniref:TMAO reductase system periplasmic protein TorT n=1 Tax=Leucobacter denitrificans TaxID=683042 RepID=A0A7G9S768_9MICO|nr:TMAO reductase system periplasmic protein TorT [Leucobacter denitrificans]QNN63693.1 TMAO reductase system periplasmic protein TorT [Leucobacter denitrificans]